MNKHDVVKRILTDRSYQPEAAGTATAPANIALCKYWGKRNEELNLPVTSSLSYTLPHFTTTTRVEPRDGADTVTLNGTLLPAEDPFAARLSAFLDLFRTDHGYAVDTQTSIPIAAGVASSSSGFAALVLALNDLYRWELDRTDCSLLARLGSGSACRSLFDHFVEWHAGTALDGMDSVAEPLNVSWPDFRIGLWCLSPAPKPVGSRTAMRRTRETSALYDAWPQQVEHDLTLIRAAVYARDLEQLGPAAESNALAMHATMLAARPPILYWQSATIGGLHQVWTARAAGIPVYATMDAGPNIKLIYCADTEPLVREHFPDMQTGA